MGVETRFPYTSARAVKQVHYIGPPRIAERECVSTEAEPVNRVLKPREKARPEFLRSSMEDNRGSPAAAKHSLGGYHDLWHRRVAQRDRRNRRPRR